MPEFITSVLLERVPETVRVPALMVVSPEKVFTPDNTSIPDPDFVKLEDPAIIPP